MTSAPLLETTDLTRRYGDFQALKPTNLTLLPGELVALTGPNGAGKSTLLLCLSGLLSPTTGSIRVEGHDLYGEEKAARQGLAYVPDVPVFYQELTAWEHLQFIAQAHHAAANFESRAERLLRDFGLWEARDLFPHAYSRGMRLKLGLALALIRPFQVLLLDEPSSALDVDSTAILAGKLAGLRDSGKAVLLTTHDPQFTEHLHAKIWHMSEGALQDGLPLDGEDQHESASVQ
jgi:ABC-2 type transport system ATP-binding protein